MRLIFPARESILNEIHVDYQNGGRTGDGAAAGTVYIAVCVCALHKFIQLNVMEMKLKVEI